MENGGYYGCIWLQKVAVVSTSSRVRVRYNMAMRITRALNKRGLTYRQKRAMEIWLKNGRASKAQALMDAGYNMCVVRQPNKVFGSPAVQAELEKRGLGPDGTENNRKPEAAFEEKLPAIGLPSMTREQISQLKEMLEGVDFRPTREPVCTANYDPANYGGMKDVLGNYQRENSVRELYNTSSM